MTGAGPGGHGEQIYKALSACSNSSYELSTADANPHFFSIGGDQSHSLPPASSPDYIDELLNLCKKLSIRALFHGSEPEMIAISRNREAFESQGIFVAINRSELVDLCVDKVALSKELEIAGYPGPRFSTLESTAARVDLDWFPVIVKPYLGGGGSRDVFICQTPTELEAILIYLKHSHPERKVFVQEYVGSAKSEFTVGVLHDSGGNFLGSAVMRRELDSTLSVRQRVQNITGRGELGPSLVVSSGVSQGVLGYFPEVAMQCRQIAEALDSRGPLNIQLRLVGTKVVVFEINPRFSGTTSLRALAGFNEPDLLLRAEMYRSFSEKPSHPKPGRVVRTLKETFVPDIEGLS